MSEFTEWLMSEMTERGCRQVDLARLSGLDSGYINQVVLGKRRPDPIRCRAMAHALNIPQVTFFTKVGHLSPRHNVGSESDELIDLFDELPLGDQQELIDIAKIKFKRYHSESTK
jgi:transcriptional regulator with XRE-family HTH domain